MKKILQLLTWIFGKILNKEHPIYVWIELERDLRVHHHDFGICEDILGEALESHHWNIAFRTLEAMVRYNEILYRRGDRYQQWECFEASLCMLNILVETEKRLPDHKGWHPERFKALYDRAWDFAALHAASIEDKTRLTGYPSPRCDKAVSMICA